MKHISISFKKGFKDLELRQLVMIFRFVVPAEGFNIEYDVLSLIKGLGFVFDNMHDSFQDLEELASNACFCVVTTAIKASKVMLNLNTIVS